MVPNSASIQRIVFQEERMTSPSPATAVAESLFRHGLTLSTAESITGGLIGSLLTDIPGCSAFFMGGVIAYSNDAKVELLGVDPRTLKEHGAVSAQTALEMARGTRSRFRTDIGVSVTGIAGPAGATPGKPVGTTYIAVNTDEGETSQLFTWKGDRLENKRFTAEAALEMVRSRLETRDG
jgi:PncC family amidohydrolase